MWDLSYKASLLLLFSVYWLQSLNGEQTLWYSFLCSCYYLGIFSITHIQHYKSRRFKCNFFLWRRNWTAQIMLHYYHSFYWRQSSLRHLIIHIYPYMAYVELWVVRFIIILYNLLTGILCLDMLCILYMIQWSLIYSSSLKSM